MSRRVSCSVTKQRRRKKILTEAIATILDARRYTPKGVFPSSSFSLCSLACSLLTQSGISSLEELEGSCPCPCPCPCACAPPCVSSPSPAPARATQPADFRPNLSKTSPLSWHVFRFSPRVLRGAFVLHVNPTNGLVFTQEHTLRVTLIFNLFL